MKLRICVARRREGSGSACTCARDPCDPAGALGCPRELIRCGGTEDLQTIVKQGKIATTRVVSGSGI
jgi:hypothetical protein